MDSVWASAGDDVLHRTRGCAPSDAVPVGVMIRESDCSGGYAVVPQPPWYVIGAVCRCGEQSP